MNTAKASTIIDFTTMSNGSITTIGDATFSLAGVGEMGDAYVQGGQLWNSSDGASYPTNTILRVDFATVVSGLKFDFLPYGLNGNALQAWTIYDSSLSVIASSAYSSGSLASYDLTAYDSISRLELHNGRNDWSQGLHRIEYDASASVPEPTTVALLGIGLVGLAGAEVRRRRKKKAVDNS